jgi:RND family efflux transporter MFP subunit
MKMNLGGINRTTRIIILSLFLVLSESNRWWAMLGSRFVPGRLDRALPRLFAIRHSNLRSADILMSTRDGLPFFDRICPRICRAPRWGALAATHLFAAAALLGALQQAEAAAPGPVAQYEVAYRDVPDMISAEGVVEAVRQSTLAAQIAGQIVELRVRVGDSVKAGQVLARIDPRAAEQAVAGSQSQVAEAQAGLNNALRNYERSKELFAKKFLSKAALDQAELDFKAAQARVAALQANAGQASTARTYTNITAPYAGMVAATPIEVGDMATPGRPLVTVFDPANMRVIATLSQSSLREVKLNLPVRVDVPALRRSVTAKQITLIPLADSRTHTVRLRLELGDAGALLPGQFARAYFITGMARKLLIPQQAVLRRSEVTGVYVVGAGAVPQLRQIRAGDVTADGFVEVLAGLHEGERVALEPIKAGLLGAGVSAATASKK